jgi:membrane associated rhomboid family serine protease
MGIQDRDYYREGSRSLLDAWGRQGAVVWLIIITTVVFFLQSMTGPRGPTTSELCVYGQYSRNDILEGEVWRLLTPLFLHASLWHLFFNMLVLYWAGNRLEDIYGSREIVLFYFAAGLFANGIYLLAQIANLTPQADAIGASGAVMGVLVLFALHFPNQRVLLFFILPVPVWLLVPLYVLMDVYGALGRAGGIAYFAHLGGALFGLLYYQSNLRFSGLFARSPRTAARRSRPTLRLLPVEPEVDSTEPVGAAVESQPRPKEAVDEHLEAKLDRVLEKVSQFGQDSLTSDEREILVKASELYKKRRK